MIVFHAENCGEMSAAHGLGSKLTFFIDSLLFRRMSACFRKRGLRPFVVVFVITVVIRALRSVRIDQSRVDSPRFSVARTISLDAARAYTKRQRKTQTAVTFFFSALPLCPPSHSLFLFLCSIV